MYILYCKNSAVHLRSSFSRTVVQWVAYCAIFVIVLGVPLNRVITLSDEASFAETC